MPDPEKKAKFELIRRLATKARRKLGKPQGDAATQFIHDYYAHVAPADMVERPEDELLGGALSIWSFLQTRRPDVPKIRVFNPDTDKDGWACDHTVIEIVNDDMPFLVDSVTAELNRHHLTVHIVIHPVVSVRRGKPGKLLELFERNGDGSHESVMHIEINEQTLPERLRSIGRSLETVLEDVRASVDDWRAMRVCVADVIAEMESSAPPVPPTEAQETIAFLRWLDDRNFTFLGYREYAFSGKKKITLSVTPESGLGVLRRDEVMIFEGMRDGAVLPDDIAEIVREPVLLMISKSNGRSTVHRAVHLDTVGIKKFDSGGRVVGERLFVGLFTSVVYNQSVHDIPVLRQKADHIVKRAGFSPVSHDGKALQHILETFPRDDLFQFPLVDLFNTAMGVLHLQERQRVALFVRHDPFSRFVSCLIFTPRERYTTALREQMQNIVEEGFGGRVTVFYVQVSDSALARLQFIVKTTRGKAFPLKLSQVEAKLAEAGRNWRDDLSHALTDEHGEARGLDLFRSYANAFPAAYRERYSAAEAVGDVARLENVFLTGDIAMDVYRPLSSPKNEVRLKVYHCDTQLPLSDILPVLENMGFRVIDEVPDQIVTGSGDNVVWIHDFGLATRSGNAVDPDRIKDNFEQLFTRVWRNEVEDDGFNRLVLAAGLNWRQIVVLRACCKFLRQAAIPFSQAYMEETLVENAAITCLIVELFESQFDPALQDRAGARSRRLRDRIERALDAVENLDEDRILRRFLNLVDSTLRTNFYQTGEDGAPKPSVSFKFDSRAIDEMPLPRPMVEIFVYSPRVEAVHLRGGKVARGGIRWSDRREDFRTEILGLMKAQMTKNAVIVPVGAKGGFVVKRPPLEGGREALQEEGIACYRTMMRGLLDITDDLRKGKIVHPPDTVRRDGDDPYLVVAADKGTATFSDIANGIARDYGFWLDDAFASGGSAGYDHKGMGITARGVWESVKRHFREMGVDTQTTDFTCIGVGDMSGDVFGNGMLLSQHIKLIGAFNHLHILVDPDPNAAKSYAERKRLFTLPRSAWSDYDAKLISKGGGVFERRAKSIKVTPQMRELFELGAKESVTPNELIRAMLGAPADLLWFGGIGTYVKAADESHADVGDRLTDAIRLNGADLRCKVIGEGANLGLTQEGRIEYALCGGRINTDFIDNSAGVSTSDHEVNIKILLGEAMAAGELTMKQRDSLLSRMTDELAAHVLMDNYRQSRALTHAEAQSAARLDEAVRFMRNLERAGKLDRNVESLPDDETLSERRAAGIGLTRPELSVLLAYSKMTLYEELLDSDVPDEPFLVQDIGLYFPAPLRERFTGFIPRHRLRREISATYITNSLVNRAGTTFVNELAQKTGASTSEIAKAYLVCRQMFDTPTLWAEIEALDNKVPAEIQTGMDLEIVKLIHSATLWMLENEARPLDVTRAIRRYASGIKSLSATLDTYLSPDLKAAVAGETQTYMDKGVPEALAGRIASLDALFPGCDIVKIAASGGYTVDSVARVYYAIGARFGLDWLRAAADTLIAETEWQAMAISAIIGDLYAQQRALATKVVDAAGGTAAAEAVVDAWALANGRGIERVENIVCELQNAGAVDLAMLSVANREIRSLVAN